MKGMSAYEMTSSGVVLRYANGAFGVSIVFPWEPFFTICSQCGVVLFFGALVLAIRGLDTSNVFCGYVVEIFQNAAIFLVHYHLFV